MLRQLVDHCKPTNLWEIAKTRFENVNGSFRTFKNLFSLKWTSFSKEHQGLKNKDTSEKSISLRFVFEILLRSAARVPRANCPWPIWPLAPPLLLFDTSDILSPVIGEIQINDLISLRYDSLHIIIKEAVLQIGNTLYRIIFCNTVRK